MKYISIFTLSLLTLLSACTAKQAETSSWVEVKGHQFYSNDKPLYFVGANYWHGAILASTGRGGNRERLIKELDMMKDCGITNLRILAGAEGPDNQPYRVTPALQTAPGVYNDTLLDGLDYLMTELAKRKMHAVLFLNNTWEWSGGFSQYANWNGLGEIPYPEIKPNTWPQFMAFSAQFLSNDSCKNQFKKHISFMLNRVNRYTNVKYTEDPAVMTWEIANEPRALSDANKPIFAQWISETAAYIKSIDNKHLVTTGTEGKHGCEQDIELFRLLHADKNIDYMTIHIWPKNWGWINTDSIPQTVDRAIELTNKYINLHIEVAQAINKPLVLEEFGLPRDHQQFNTTDATTARDKYYQNAFNQVVEHAKNGGVIAGTNFWAFAGMARPAGDENPFWKNGDDLMGDPPQEEQGLNSVFDTDSTMQVIKQHANQLNSVVK